MRALWTVVFTSLAVFVLVSPFSPPAVSAEKVKSLDEFARCLTAKNATMYGSFWCRHCDDQKKLFGSSFQYVRYIECSVVGSRRLSLPCQVKQIRYTPAWIFDDEQRLYGLQPLESLSQKTGCALPGVAGRQQQKQPTKGGHDGAGEHNLSR